MEICSGVGWGKERMGYSKLLAQPAKPTAYSRVSINLRQANLLAISFGAPLVYFRQRLVSIIKNRLAPTTGK